MKALKLIIIGTILFFAAFSVQAQISVHLNLGTAPDWGPSGYSDVRYYYLPDVEAYYDISSSMFIYNNGVTWVHRSSLPSRYRNYDLYNGYKVPMSNYRGERPYTSFRQNKVQYAKGYRGAEQHSIGQRPERGNSNQEGNRGNDKNKGKGNDKGNGRR